MNFWADMKGYVSSNNGDGRLNPFEENIMQHCFINEKKLAEMTGVSLPTLRRWASEGHGPTRIKIGPRRVGYREEEVVEWINSRTAYNGRGAKNAA